MAVSSQEEATLAFPCCGGVARVLVVGDGAEVDAEAARRRLLGWEGHLTRFEPDSELSLLNADARERVPASDLLMRFVATAVAAARRTRGLVDPTLAGEIVAAGYADDLVAPSVALVELLALAPPRAPARPATDAGWRHVGVDRDARSVHRPPGTLLDSGGIAKGLFADLAAAALARRSESYAVDCCGDLRLGGRLPRTVEVDDPFGRGVRHRFELHEGGVATSGIGRRSWIDADGRPAHHLLDPASGRPAFTGVVQATALAATAVEAETRAKAALLSGPAGARRWLGQGGVLVLDDGSHEVIAP